MTPDELSKKTERLKQEAEAIQSHWNLMLPADFCPDTRQCVIWLNMYGGFDNVVEAIERTCSWLQRKDQKNEQRIIDGKEPFPPKDKTAVIRYCSGVMKNLHLGINPMDGTIDE